MQPEPFGSQNPENLRGKSELYPNLWLIQSGSACSGNVFHKPEQDKGMSRTCTLCPVKTIDPVLFQKAQITAVHSYSMDDNLYQYTPAPCLKYPIGLYNSFI